MTKRAPVAGGSRRARRAGGSVAIAAILACAALQAWGKPLDAGRRTACVHPEMGPSPPVVWLDFPVRQGPGMAVVDVIQLAERAGWVVESNLGQPDGGFSTIITKPFGSWASESDIVTDHQGIAISLNASMGFACA